MHQKPRKCYLQRRLLSCMAEQNNQTQGASCSTACTLCLTRNRKFGSLIKTKIRQTEVWNGAKFAQSLLRRFNKALSTERWRITAITGKATRQKRCQLQGVVAQTFDDTTQSFARKSKDTSVAQRSRAIYGALAKPRNDVWHHRFNYIATSLLIQTPY